MSAFTADEAAQIFEVVGIPRGGAGRIVTSLSHLPPALAHTWEPTYTTGDFSSVVTLIEGAINGASPAVATRTRVHLTRWDSIGGTNPMRLNAGSAGEQGVVVDYSFNARTDGNGALSE
jgi:hypothetical protein